MLKTILFFLLLLPMGLRGQESGPPCFKDISANFFNYDIVSQAFALTDVYQFRWLYLYNYLQRQATQVPQLAIQTAQKQNPNPLVPPYNAAVAAQVLYLVLYTVFEKSMFDNQIINRSDINQMFTYIWNRQKPLLLQCFGPVPIIEQHVTN